jgi:predicted Zn-dependent peptidase
MRHLRFPLFALMLGISLASCGRQEEYSFRIPVEYYRLDNGLRVVLSPDTTAPTAIVGVYYNIGFRIEPRDRTGFAHLFEHMMFQGSENLGKMEFIRLVQRNGGVLNGSTRFDFTNYYQIVPSHTLETILWGEADRMKGLAITEENLANQKGVVTNEVKVNVLNQPYGGFPWLDLPQAANTNWYNAHNFYGDLEDLQAATLKDVKDFFTTYYAPNNAVLVIAGAFDPGRAKEWVTTYFESIPRAAQAMAPDLSEPRQESAKRVSKEDRLASRPALAVGYHMPARNTPEYYAMGLLDQILLQGDDSMLRQVLVQQKGMTSAVTGGINAYLGNMFDYNGPMLWSLDLVHDTTTPVDAVVAAVDSVLEAVQSNPLPAEVIERARVKFRSQFYDMTTDYYGFGRANLLASFALFDDDPARINTVEDNIRDVSADLLQRTAREYLRKTNQTVLAILPRAGQ